MQERTQKQKFTSSRNFQKMRLTGFSIDTKFLTLQEAVVYERLRATIDLLLERWDDNSVLLGIKLKPYKCFWCGKRSNSEHIYSRDGKNYCKKCLDSLH